MKLLGLNAAALLVWAVAAQSDDACVCSTSIVVLYPPGWEPDATAAAVESSSTPPCTTYTTTSWNTYVYTEPGSVVTEGGLAVTVPPCVVTTTVETVYTTIQTLVVSTGTATFVHSGTTLVGTTESTYLPSTADPESNVQSTTAQSTIPSTLAVASSTSSLYSTGIPSASTSSDYSNTTSSAVVSSIPGSSAAVSSSASSSVASSTVVSSTVTSSTVASSTTPSSCITPPANKVIFSTELQGNTFVNHGLVGAGSVASDATDQFGDTLGGWGSAIAVDQASWQKNSDGTYTGILYAQPDRGWNTEHTVDFTGRIHTFAITLTPYYCDESQTASNQLEFEYQGSVLLQGPGGLKSTGLDALTIATVDGTDYPAAFLNGVDGDKGVSFDLEGLVHDPNDGTFWSSDEYGPYIYHHDSEGNIISSIVPPDAYIPHINGVKNFTADSDPDDGRESNHGFEGLSISADGQYLWAVLQAALVQDGGTHATREEYTRLLKYDITDSLNPVLTDEYVVKLPSYNDPNETKNPRTGATSELHVLTESLFLILPHDGNGYGSSTSDKSIYRHAELVDLSSATNIAGNTYDATGAAVAPDGESLASGVVAATSVPFIDYNIESELERVGLHNGDPDDDTDLYSKWESFALVPTFNGDDDYFLITVSDNDFITQNGNMNGEPYSDASGLNIPTRGLVFWVTLPGLDQGPELVDAPEPPR